jgi:hypothetical protein
MASIATRIAWAASGTAADPTVVSVTLSAGTGRKLVVCSILENATATTDGATFDGVPLTRFVDNDRVNGVTQSWLFLDIPDAKGAGTYNLSVDLSAGSIRHSLTGWITAGDTVGTPRTATASTGPGVSTVTASIAAAAGDALLTVVDNANSTPNFASAPSSSEVTFGSLSSVSTAGTRCARSDAIGDATETVSATWAQNSTDDTRRMYLINTTPAAAPPPAPTERIRISFRPPA